MKRLLALLVICMLLPCAAQARSDVTLDVTPLYQKDYPKVLFEYDGKKRSVATSGCGAVCVAMAMTYLNADNAQTPEELFQWAYDNDLYHGLGLSCNALLDMLENFGYEGEWIGKESKNLRQQLKNGFPVIAAMGPGHFTKNGHYILIYGIDPKDRVRVIDPNSEARSLKKYDLQMILDEIAGSHAFLICSLPEGV